MENSKDRETIRQQIIRQQLWVSIYEKTLADTRDRNPVFYANKAVEEFDKTFNNNLKSEGGKQ